MPQPDGALRLALRLAQIAHRREYDVGRAPTLEEVQQGRDERGREPQKGERVKEEHQPGRARPSAAWRSAWPNGVSVVTRW